MYTVDERTRQADKQERKRLREARLSLVRASPELRLGLNERVFRINLLLVYGTSLALAITDYVRGRLHLTAIMYEHGGWAVLGLALSIILMIVAIIDLATYKPRLFTLSSSDCRQFFRKLAEFSGDFDSYLHEIRNTPAKTWRQIARFRDNLIKEASNVIIVDRLRARIILRVLVRIGSLVLCLSMLCYMMSYATGHDVLAGAPDSGGYIPHLYFTAVTFFTIGYGNIYPANDLIGYLFTFVCVLIIALVFYFFIAEALAAQFAFSGNLRDSAESYILRISALEVRESRMGFKED